MLKCIKITKQEDGTPLKKHGYMRMPKEMCQALVDKGLANYVPKNAHRRAARQNERLVR